MGLLSRGVVGEKRGDAVGSVSLLVTNLSDSIR